MSALCQMYGPAVRYKMDFRDQRTCELHQCIRPLKWSNLLRAIMGIRAHPRLTKRKTSKGHHGTQSLGCAGQTVRPSLHSISQTSAGKVLISIASLLFSLISKTSLYHATWAAILG